jgi:DNA processing protein
MTDKELIKAVNNLEKLGEQKSSVPLKRYSQMCLSAREKFTKQGLSAGPSSGDRLSLVRDDYPALLREINDPPPFLYYLGNAALLSRVLVSIVGSRKLAATTTPECERLLLACKQHNVVTVSGLAYGVDALVHRRSIALEIPTIAVLPSCLSDITPRTHQALAREIIASGGLVISEHIAPQDKGGKYIFPRRNRIIAGLSLATVVLQAGSPSGALITAKQAHGYNRAVFASAVLPTNPDYLGNQKLLDSQIAQPLTLEMTQLWNSLSLESELGKQLSKSSIDITGLTEIEIQVMRALIDGADNPTAVAEALQQTNIDTGVMMQILGKLELKGKTSRDGYGRIKIL